MSTAPLLPGESALPPALIAAYRATRYVAAATPVGPVVLRPEQNCAELLRLHAHLASQAVALKPAAAFLTACNPRGQRLPEARNQQRQAALATDLERAGWPYFAALGIGEEPTDWPPEPSFLVLGIARDRALQLGRDYQQNAILVVDAGARVELLLLR